VGEEELAEAIGRLTADGAIDDPRFARRYAEDKRALAGWGSERIRGALAQRGLDQAQIEAAVAAEGEPDQVLRATELLDRRAAPVGTEADRARALSLLARRGYPLEVAYEAVRVRERRAA
jgi:regulatory protein